MLKKFLRDLAETRVFERPFVLETGVRYEFKVLKQRVVFEPEWKRTDRHGPMDQNISVGYGHKK